MGPPPFPDPPAVEGSNPAFDRRRVLLVVALVVLAAGAFFPVSFARAPRLWRSLADAAHLPVFTLWTFVLAHSLPTRVLRARPTVRVVILAALSALAIEGLQAFVGRTPSLRDLGVGWLGIALAGAILATYRRGRWWEWGLIAIACVLSSLLVLAPVWIEWRTWELQRRSFPSLGEFEHELEVRLWPARQGEGQARSLVRPATEGATSGSRSLRIETERGSWGGVEYDGGLADWSGFGTLTFTVMNPGDKFELNLRLEQACTCREPRALTLSYPIAPGENRLRVPLDRLPPTPDGSFLELKQIARLALFAGADEPPRLWFLDAVRLET